MLHTRDLAGTIEVDGLQYLWAIQREPQWCTADGWKGMTIAVNLQNAQREAILEFPMPSARRSKLQPQLRRSQVNQRIIENGVRAGCRRGGNRPPGERRSCSRSMPTAAKLSCPDRQLSGQKLGKLTFRMPALATVVLPNLAD